MTQGKNRLDALFGNFSIVKSFRQPRGQYVEHALSILENYNDALLAKPRYGKHVYTFNDYVDKFLIYIGNLESPITFSNYFGSNRAGLDTTGLSVQFMVSDANNDRLKNRFFNHSDFAKYVKIAANHGFRVKAMGRDFTWF